MIHRSLNHDIVRVLAFACPLISHAQIVPKYFRVDSLLRIISKLNVTVKGKKERSLRQIHRDYKMVSKSSCIELLIIFLLFLNRQKICSDSKQPININVYGKGCQKVLTYNHFS